MPLIFRSMLRDGAKPLVGSEKSMLGVRVPPHPQADVHPDEREMVKPGEGMSVAPDWRALPHFLIPRRLQPLAKKATGNNRLVCWKTGSGPFSRAAVAEGLQLRPDAPGHGVVEPAEPMHVASFQERLAGTRDGWTVIDEEPQG